MTLNVLQLFSPGYQHCNFRRLGKMHSKGKLTKLQFMHHSMVPYDSAWYSFGSPSWRIPLTVKGTRGPHPRSRCPYKTCHSPFTGCIHPFTRTLTHPNYSFTHSDMHLIFERTDLMARVAYALRPDPASLAAMARTCESLYEPAMDVLWGELDGLEPMLYCVTSLVYVNFKRDVSPAFAIRVARRYRLKTSCHSTSSPTPLECGNSRSQWKVATCAS